MFYGTHFNNVFLVLHHVKHQFCARHIYFIMYDYVVCIYIYIYVCLYVNINIYICMCKKKKFIHIFFYIYIYFDWRDDYRLFTAACVPLWRPRAVASCTAACVSLAPPCRGLVYCSLRVSLAPPCVGLVNCSLRVSLAPPCRGLVNCSMCVSGAPVRWAGELQPACLSGAPVPWAGELQPLSDPPPSSTSWSGSNGAEAVQWNKSEVVWLSRGDELCDAAARWSLLTGEASRDSVIHGRCSRLTGDFDGGGRAAAAASLWAHGARAR